jgi:type II secretory pathway pseudopilin PulG
MREKIGPFRAPELLVVVVTLAILAALTLYRLAKFRATASHVQCANNLKNVGAAFLLFAHDHHDLLPFQISTNSGGVRELSSDIVANFSILSNELVVPVLLTCPARKMPIFPATNWHHLSASNIGFFVGLTGRATNPISILGGDSDFLIDGAPSPGKVEVRPTQRFTYPLNLHTDARPASLLWADGRVEYFDAMKIRADLSIAQTTNVFLSP